MFEPSLDDFFLGPEVEPPLFICDNIIYLSFIILPDIWIVQHGLFIFDIVSSKCLVEFNQALFSGFLLAHHYIVCMLLIIKDAFFLYLILSRLFAFPVHVRAL